MGIIGIQRRVVSFTSDRNRQNEATSVFNALNHHEGLAHNICMYVVNFEVPNSISTDKIALNHLCKIYYYIVHLLASNIFSCFKLIGSQKTSMRILVLPQFSDIHTQKNSSASDCDLFFCIKLALQLFYLMHCLPISVSL